MTMWILIRAAGIGAYVMLFLSVAWGLVSTTGVVTKRVSKASSNQFHAFSASAGLALLGAHIGLLLLDSFMPFGPVDVLVPLHATYRPVATGLGVVAMYTLVLIIVSSWARKHLTTRRWRAIHALSVPAFTLSLLHGVFAGSDTTRPWMAALYGVTGLTTLFLVLVRGLTAGQARAARTARPERAATGLERASGRNVTREPAPAA
jgi:methionine sulfoxide reductase heme-binding subunit